MSNRRLREKAEKAQIQRENPELWTGLRKPGQPSKIFNRKEAEAEYQSNIEAARELARKQAVELDGSAPTGQAAPAPAPAPAPANSGFTGVAGRNVGFSSNANAGFSGVSGSQVGFKRESPTATPTGAPPRRETFAEEDARTRREKTLSGAFGEKAQAKAENLEGRKGLFAEMRTAATEGGNTTGFRDRAKALGIDEAGYARGIARAEGTAVPTLAPTVAGPAAPLTGRALAEKNIATMGQAGAAADYFKRRDTEMLAKQSKQIDRATATPPTYRSGETRSAPASATPSFSSMFSREVDNDMAPMPSTPTASAQPSARSEGMENYGTFTPPAPRPVSRVEAQAIPRSERNYLERQVSGQITGTDIAKTFKEGGAFVREGVKAARSFRDRTNQRSASLGENLRTKLGIQ
jgi:hypothetical protein